MKKWKVRFFCLGIILSSMAGSVAEGMVEKREYPLANIDILETVVLGAILGMILALILYIVYEIHNFRKIE